MKIRGSLSSYVFGILIVLGPWPGSGWRVSAGTSIGEGLKFEMKRVAWYVHGMQGHAKFGQVRAVVRIVPGLHVVCGP